jgi:hypothetical protein
MVYIVKADISISDNKRPARRVLEKQSNTAAAISAAGTPAVI